MLNEGYFVHKASGTVQHCSASNIGRVMKPTPNRLTVP